MTAFPYQFCKPCIAPDVLKQRKPPIYYPEKIIHIVLNFFDLPEHRVFSDSRKRELVDCRFFIMIFLKAYCKISLTSIGKKFPGDKGSGYHYTSVLNGIQTINDLMENNDRIRGIYNELKFRMEGN